MAILLLPPRALRLAGIFLVPLLLWYLSGETLSYLLIQGGVRVAYANTLAGVAVLSLVVLVRVTVTIGMLHSLRRGLPALSRASMGGRGGLAAAEGSVFWAEEERILDVLSRAVLPFLIFYAAWGLIVEDARAFSVASDELHPAATGFDPYAVPFWPQLGVAVGSLLLRVLCQRRYERTGGRAIGMTSALFEGLWTFFGLFTIVTVLGWVTDWITHRAVWVGAGELLRSLADAFAPFGVLGTWAAEIAPHVKDGLIQPLIWLILAAIVYGIDVRPDRGMTEERPELARVAGRVAARAGRALRLAHLLSKELREKYVPMLNGLRLVARVGLPIYLFYCVCYVALVVLVRWVWLAVVRLIGPVGSEAWPVILVPIDFLAETATVVLRICLVAVALDIIVSRVSGKSLEIAGTPDSAGRPRG